MAPARVRFLLRGRPRHDVTGLRNTIALAEPILAGLGFGAGRVATIETDDPDALGEALRAIAPAAAGAAPGELRAGRRQARRDAARAPRVAARRARTGRRRGAAAGAPFGAVEIDVEGCTLCLACVSACPTGALSADTERPMLRFAEDACVQCGLCKATCPEKVITLRAAARFPRRHRGCARAQGGSAVRLHPLRQAVRRHGARSSASPPSSKASTGCIKDSAQRLDVIKMCEDCRVAVMAEQEFDPLRHAAPAGAHHRGLSARARGAGQARALRTVS